MGREEQECCNGQDFSQVDSLGNNMNAWDDWKIWSNHTISLIHNFAF